MIKTNIKMRVTPEQSKKVQEICFENNIGWFTAGKNFIETDKEFLFIDFCITFTNKYYFESEVSREEIDADLFIKTNGTCEETFESLCNDFINENMKPSKSSQLYNEKYTSQPKDLESALKKIENLHIALNKKVEKIKNQALEITNLLEQKKDLQQQRINESKGYCDLKKEVDDLQEENSKLEEQLKEKDTIILHLESKLK